MSGRLPSYPPRCPHCKNDIVYYSHRANAWEWIVLLFGGRPYRCRYCSRRFVAFYRNFSIWTRLFIGCLWLAAMGVTAAVLADRGYFGKL